MGSGPGHQSPDCFYLDLCVSAGLKRIWLPSPQCTPTPPIKQNKTLPRPSCLSTGSQLSITCTWVYLGPATQIISEHRLTSSHAGPGSVNSSSPARAGRVEESSAGRKPHSCIPQPKRNTVCVIASVICQGPCFPPPVFLAASLASFKSERHPCFPGSTTA